MTRTKSFTSTIFLLLIVLFPINSVYGHGWGLDTTNIDFNGREITVSVELPQYFEESKKIIKINAFDEEAEQNAKNVTFLIGLYKNDETIFRNYFLAPDGDLKIHVKPIEEGDTEIIAQQDPLLDAWYETEEQPIELVGPIFKRGGLFHFEIELRTIDEPTNIVEDLGTYIADVSIAETTSYDEIDLEGNVIPFRMKSYFDQILNFNYDEEKNVVTFDIPFDWSEEIISHIPVVHEEVHFPKNFVPFLTAGYTGKVNGIDLFKSNVIIDDYTEEEERIVHFVLLQDHLKYLNQEQKKSNSEISNFMHFTLEVSDKIEFPMTAYTRDEQFQIDLSWDPVEIEPGKNTNFVFTIRDGATGEPLRKSTYDFVILQSNVEIYRTSGNAQIGGEAEEFQFSEEQTGPTVIRFENIRGTGLSTEFGILVVPEFGMIVSFVLIVAITSMIVLSKKIERISI